LEHQIYWNLSRNQDSFFKGKVGLGIMTELSHINTLLIFMVITILDLTHLGYSSGIGLGLESMFLLKVSGSILSAANLCGLI
jgi:hypothetical protein